MKKFESTLTVVPLESGDCAGTPPEFGRVPDVTRLYGLRRGTIYNLLRTGRIKGVLLRVTGEKSGCRLIHLNSVRALLREQMEATERKGASK